MAVTNYKKYEQTIDKIHKKYKLLRLKQNVLFFSVDAAVVLLTFFVFRLIFNENHLQWFLLSLLFTVVFPITLHSKKLKHLHKIEKEQIKFADSEITNF